MSSSSLPFPSATSVIGATLVAGSIAFFFGAADGSTPLALAVAGSGGLFTGLLLHRPRSRSRTDGRLTFRTPEQLRLARQRLIQARALHAEHLKERQGVRRRLGELLGKMRQVGLSAYSTRIVTIERGLATLDRQIAVIAKLRDGYDRSLRMIDIELEAGHAADLLDEDIGSAIGFAMDELRLLEESQRDLARQLEANDEVEGLTARPATGLASAMLLAALLVGGTAATAQDLTPVERARIDSAVVGVLAGTGAPSASIAIVRGGRIVHERAYGNARDAVPATPAMRYAIGSVSKQFTAAAVLLLAEDGKLSLDDKVAKWYPTLTSAGDITLRHLLSMTSGYQDYWPQDYVFTDMQRPVSADEIMRRWAGKALDFAPGAKWQYSNTNYVIAAAIVERASGMPFMQFLRQRVFDRLGMATVADFDVGPLSSADAAPYLRNAVGPLRPAPKEGRGWLFGAGQLAMTARDLARWNIAVMNHELLRDASYREQERDMLLGSGLATGYGLGVNVGSAGGRRRIAHGGAVSGYTTTNQVYPDDTVAITVFTNIYPGAAGANGQIAGRIAGVLFATNDSAVASARAHARRIYDGLAKGTIERSLFTDNANAYFTAEVLADYAASLGPLGAPVEFVQTSESLRGGMVIRNYTIRAGARALGLTTMTMPDGRIEQFIVARAS